MLTDMMTLCQKYDWSQRHANTLISGTALLNRRNSSFPQSLTQSYKLNINDIAMAFVVNGKVLIIIAQKYKYIKLLFILQYC